MSKTIKLRKGLDIRLLGEAEKVKTSVDAPETVAIKPPDFHLLTPKMEVKAGDKVKAGSVLFHNKYNDKIKFVSPVSGEVADVVRGAKRRILEVVINADAEIQYEQATVPALENMSRDEVLKTLLDSGLWPFVRQRPIDIIADPDETPKAIFISAFNSAPLAPDMDFIVHGQDELFQKGIDVLSKLTDGKIHLNVKGNGAPDAAFMNAKGVQINNIYGKHPAGNVGIQIHHIDPLNKGEVIWFVNPQDLIIIGKYFSTGMFDASKIVALTGSEVSNPKYIKTIIGTNLSKLVEGNIDGDNVRYISGNVLTGEKVEPNGYLGYYDNQITVIPEGNQLKFVLTKGWMAPGFDKFSNSMLFPTWLTGSKKFRLDTNTNGEERGFVVTGEMEKVFPMDIYPMYLVKAIMVNDIDAMENLGIYEVAPEDLALCEYVCTSKVNIQSVVRDGLDVIYEECM
ncbi:MAG: Na(+)-translocating NADH-quinone reductase subunit A [Crocinitomicaceae bacterium]|nr:Na(+)-translocating NADH-quinone reductase subunit A [Crocinitomicaceae bacterium]